MDIVEVYDISNSGKKVHALATGNSLTMRLIGHGQLGQGHCQRTIKCDT
jgi:hypothetical protein